MPDLAFTVALRKRDPPLTRYAARAEIYDTSGNLIDSQTFYESGKRSAHNKGERWAKKRIATLRATAKAEAPTRKEQL